MPIFIVADQRDVLVLAAIIGGSLAGVAVLTSTTVILVINRATLFDCE